MTSVALKWRTDHVLCLGPDTYFSLKTNFYSQIGVANFSSEMLTS